MDLSINYERSPAEALQKFAEKFQVSVDDAEFAIRMDESDPLRKFREKFTYPKKMNLVGVDKELVKEKDEECIYLCGNSLGLKPKATDAFVQRQLTEWGETGVEVHFNGPLPAAFCDLYGRESMGRLVGADPSGVILMNGLSVNLNLLLMSFYQPSGERCKIALEKNAFPSDRYALHSQAAIRGYDPETTVMEIGPRDGEDTLRTDDIIKLLQVEGSSISVLCLSGVQYYTGQKFDMKTITEEAHKHGIIVGWDLAHAVGNVRIELDKWGVDFACWCTYKYLNSGPGCIAGAYVNKKHNNRKVPHLSGWWSNKQDTRFQMYNECDLAPGIQSFRISNPPPLLVACVVSSLEIFDEAGFDELLRKQFLLTGYLEHLIESALANLECDRSERGALEKGRSKGRHNDVPFVRVITPRNPAERGCQLSLEFSIAMDKAHKQLARRGVLVDFRLPSAIRVAPIPLYNSFQDVYNFVNTLQEVLKQLLLESH